MRDPETLLPFSFPFPWLRFSISVAPEIYGSIFKVVHSTIILTFHTPTAHTTSTSLYIRAAPDRINAASSKRLPPAAPKSTIVPGLNLKSWTSYPQLI